MALSSALLACAVSLFFSFFNGIEDNNTVCTIEPSASLIVANPRNFIAVDNSPSRLRNGSFARAIAVLCFNGITCHQNENNCGYTKHENFIYHHIYLAVTTQRLFSSTRHLYALSCRLYSSYSSRPTQRTRPNNCLPHTASLSTLTVAPKRPAREGLPVTIQSLQTLVQCHRTKGRHMTSLGRHSILRHSHHEIHEPVRRDIDQPVEQTHPKT